MPNQVFVEHNMANATSFVSIESKIICMNVHALCQFDRSVNMKYAIHQISLPNGHWLSHTLRPLYA